MHHLAKLIVQFTNENHNYKSRHIAYSIGQQTQQQQQTRTGKMIEKREKLLSGLK